MVWPIDVDPARTDERTVNFNIGHFWGRLPHTRFAILPGAGGGQFSWMTRGVVIQSNQAPNAAGFSVGNTYEGFATLDSIDWRFVYRWNYVAYPDVMGIQFTATKLTAPTGTIFYRRTGIATENPAMALTMPLFSNVPGWNPRPDAFLKVDLPEWVIASEVYPDAVVTTPA